MTIKELIQNCIERHLPFFCYRRPSHPIRFGIQTSPLEAHEQPVNLDKVHGYVVAPFSANAPYYLIKEDGTVDIEHPQLTEDDLPDLSATAELKGKDSKDIDRVSYTKKVAEAIEKIKEGALNKVVYSHTEHIDGAYIENAVQIFSKLSAAYPQAYIAMVNLPGNGLWMCATPELLLYRNGQDLQTIALAGTRRIQVDGTPWDEKNKEEQQIVERYIVNTLRQHCTSINVTPVTTTRAGHLEHLLTRIGMKMPVGQSAENLLKALHPTPAVGGTPKQESYEAILAQEGYDREFYSGFLGHISDENHFALYVNLRCMKLTPKGTTLYAGGGITADSDPLTEWEETKMKLETLKRFLN